ncbi:RidA family protein [Planctomycetota bacterium]
MESIASDNAPAAIGPYCQAIKTGNFVFCSGQLGIDPTTGNLAPDVEGQTRQIFRNLTAVLKAASLTLQNVAKTTVFLASMDDFATVNAVYAEVFGGHKPARATVEVSRLPLNAHIEVECIAVSG